MILIDVKAKIRDSSSTDLKSKTNRSYLYYNIVADNTPEYLFIFQNNHPSLKETPDNINFGKLQFK